MKISGFAFETTDWAEVEPTAHAGETGEARWRTRHFGDVRVRIFAYSAGISRTTGARRGT